MVFNAIIVYLMTYAMELSTGNVNISISSHKQGHIEGVNGNIPGNILFGLPGVESVPCKKKMMFLPMEWCFFLTGPFNGCLLSLNLSCIYNAEKINVNPAPR